MPEYDAQLTLREARRRYFEANAFPPDGGYGEDWVKLSIGPIPVAFPNTEGRRRAVPFHDLHHVATGYDTSLVGEAEIGAWEIASGCVSVPAALILNLLVIWPVLFFAPGAVYRAFLRGRHERNLYAEHYDDALLERDVGWLRAQLGIDAPHPAASTPDRLAFVGWMTVVVGLQLGILTALIGLTIWLYRAST